MVYIAHKQKPPTEKATQHECRCEHMQRNGAPLVTGRPDRRCQSRSAAARRSAIGGGNICNMHSVYSTLPHSHALQDDGCREVSACIMHLAQ